MSDTNEVSAARSPGPHPPRVCPKCGDPRVLRSHRRNRLENLLSSLNYYPYRCQICQHRFVAKAPAEMMTKPVTGEKRPRLDGRKRRSRALRRTIVISAICVAVFLIFLHYLLQPPTYTGD